MQALVFEKVKDPAIRDAIPFKTTAFSMISGLLTLKLTRSRCPPVTVEMSTSRSTVSRRKSRGLDVLSVELSSKGLETSSRSRGRPVGKTNKNAETRAATTTSSTTTSFPPSTRERQKRNSRFSRSSASGKRWAWSTRRRGP